MNVFTRVNETLFEQIARLEGVDSLTRRVACDLNLGKIRAKKLLKTCEKAGLFDHEMWAEGKGGKRARRGVLRPVPAEMRQGREG